MDWIDRVLEKDGDFNQPAQKLKNVQIQTLNEIKKYGIAEYM